MEVEAKAGDDLDKFLIGHGGDAIAILKAFGLPMETTHMSFTMEVGEIAYVDARIWVRKSQAEAFKKVISRYRLAKIGSIEEEDEPMNEEVKSEAQIEQEIQDKGLTSPRLTPEHIDAQIAKVDYYVFPDTTSTICRIGLVNGFSVIGHSACVSIENFDEEIGRNIAYKNAREQIWQLEGYALACRLAGA